jgi:hypothetical protein
MRKAITVFPIVAGALMLVACSQKTGDEAGATANSAVNDASDDTNSTMGAMNNAANAATPSLHSAGNSLDNAMDATGSAIGKAGNSLDNSTH